MKTLPVIFFSLLLFGQIKAQKFNTLYHARMDGRANAVITTNNGYISVGTAANALNSYIAEINSSGDTIWGSNFEVGKGAGNIAYTISKLNKNRYVVGGLSADTSSHSSAAFLIWLKENGDTIRVRTYGTDTNSERCYGIRELANGNIVFVGFRFKKPDKLGKTDCDVYIVGMDSTGHQQWENVFGGAKDDQIVSMDRAKDGGFILGGTTFSYGTKPYSMYLVKIDTLGQFKWQQTYAKRLSSYGSSVITTQDSGYAIVGGSSTDAIDTTLAYIVKTDANGAIQWQRQYKASPYGFSEFTGIKQLPTGELVVCGHYAATANDYRVYGWLMKLDQHNGNIIWQRDYRYFSADSTQHYMFGMDLAPDGGFVMCGMERELRSSFTYGNQVWLVKTDSLGCDSVNCVATGVTEFHPIIQEEQTLLVPNPFSAIATVSYLFPTNAKTAFLSVYNINGALVRRYALNSQESTLNISASDFENGVYLYGIESENYITAKKKMVVVK